MTGRGEHCCSACVPSAVRCCPFFVWNEIVDPSVDASSWSLTVNGLVGNPKTYRLEDVEALPQTAIYNTFECRRARSYTTVLGTGEAPG